MEHASASEGGALHNFVEVVLVFKNLMLKFIHILNMSSICTKCMVQRVRGSCRRMAMKLNCIAAPDVAHSGNVQGTSSGSHHTPVHHGARSSTRTPSQSTARTASASAGRVVASGSRGRGKEITTPEPSDEDDGDSSSSSSHAASSERGDPMYMSETPMDVLFDAPPATQTQGELTSQVMNLKISF
jgi:hypothetical protein